MLGLWPWYGSKPRIPETLVSLRCREWALLRTGVADGPPAVWYGGEYGVPEVVLRLLDGEIDTSGPMR